MKTIEDPKRRLAQEPNAAECWLWCSECRRFFQYEAAKATRLGTDECPFADCNGYGLGFHLFWWDDMREPKDPRWPDGVDQLRHGLRSPEMEPFYRARLLARIEERVGAFAASPECKEALGESAPRFIAALLRMMADLSWDLTETEEENAGHFALDIARLLLADLPVWSQTDDVSEAPRMSAELRAFFAFAGRTASVSDARHWMALVADDELDALFLHTMKHDRRLRKSTPTPRKTKRPGRRATRRSKANRGRARRR